jgi:hypothetical protein
MLIAAIALLIAACAWVTVTAVVHPAPLTVKAPGWKTFESCRTGNQRRYRHHLADLQADRERSNTQPPPFQKAADATVAICMDGNVIR